MKNLNKTEWFAIVLAVTMLWTSSAYSFFAPKGAWWCTAFSMTTNAAVEESNEERGEIRFEWKIVELWQDLRG